MHDPDGKYKNILGREKSLHDALVLSPTIGGKPDPDTNEPPRASGRNMEFHQSRLLRHITSNLHISSAQIRRLIVPSRQKTDIRHYTASLIIVRIQLISAFFALVVPLWSIVDLLSFNPPLSLWLTLLRFGAGLIFVILAWPRTLSATRPYTQAILMLLGMMTVPSAFYLATLMLLSFSADGSVQEVMTQFYVFMPVVVLAGLAIFPLTALEIFLLSLPTLAVTVFGIFADHVQHVSLTEDFIVLWAMVMVLGVSIFSGMSQLHCVETMVQRAMTDPLTGTASRRSGMETLRLLFHLSAASRKPLSVAFFDIDHFKRINDAFGHDAGDHILQQATERLRGLLRHSDTLVRWGGEEFLVILPDMSAHQLTALTDRLVATGLGNRPDGQPLTASVGVAETRADKTSDWHALVELADQRMYEAKHQGRARAVLPGNVTINLWPAATDVRTRVETPVA